MTPLSGSHAKTQFLLLEWFNMLHRLPAREINLDFITFLRQAHQLEILPTIDLISSFYNLCIEICVMCGLLQQAISSVPELH